MNNPALQAVGLGVAGLRAQGLGAGAGFPGQQPGISAEPAKFATRAEAEKAAHGFEAIFLRMVISDMRKNAEAFGDGGMFGKSEGSDIKSGWFDSMLASHVSNSGRIGLADRLLDDWTEAKKIPPPAAEQPKDTDVKPVDRYVLSARRLRDGLGEDLTGGAR